MIGKWQQKNETSGEKRRRWVLALVVSLLLQVPLLLVVYYVIDHSIDDVDFKSLRVAPVAIYEQEPPTPDDGTVSDRVIEEAMDEPSPEEEPPDIVPDGTEVPVGQVVSVVPAEAEELPDSARYAARFAVKVDEEKKAAQASKDQKIPQKYSKVPQPEKRPAQRKGQRQETLSQTDSAGTETSELGTEVAPEGAQAGPGEPSDGPDGLALLAPELAGQDPVTKYQPSSAPFASDDFIPDVEKTAETNLLNTVPYRYAGFFERVKRGVRRHWDPNRLYRLRDPSGELYGHKDRYTVLSVVLDDRGYILDTTITSPSGLGFLDSEAQRAFLAAGPFLNPPQGLASNDGKIRFDFGFAFLIASSRQQVFWRWQ
jgi:outer membrane biosynthesis protein TonB